MPGESSAYARLRPVYSMNILGYNHFSDDEDALRIFQLYDPARNKRFPKEILNFGYFELSKQNTETENQRQWQNYFLQKPLTDDAPDYIKDALHIIDRANMDEEELDMMTKAEYYRSVLDNQIHYAIDETKLGIAKKMLLNNESIEKIADYTGLSFEAIEKIEQTILVPNNG